MPVGIEDFQSGETSNGLEEDIITFLTERKKEGFTSLEIMMATKWHPDFSTPEVAKMSTFAIADFTKLLHDLVRRGRVRIKTTRNRVYFTAGGKIHKRPKRKRKTVRTRRKKPRKMASRTNKKDLTKFIVAVPTEIVEKVDKLIERYECASRSHAVTKGLVRLLEETRQQRHA